MVQAVLVTVGGWQRKSSEVSNRIKDGLIAVVKQGFDAMSALLEKDSDPKKVQGVLRRFDVSRSIAFQFDKAKDDPLRDLVYGLLESLHGSLNEWNEERNQRKNTGEFSTQTDKIPNPLPSFPVEPKEEPTDFHQGLQKEISTSELMRDEKLVKEEEMDNESNELNTAQTDAIFPDSLNILEQALNSAHSIQFNPAENPTDFSQVLPRYNRTSPLMALQDEMDFKEEKAHNDDMNSGMDNTIGDPLNEPLFTVDGSAHQMIQPSNFKDEFSGNRDLALTTKNLFNEGVINMKKSGAEDDILANDMIDNEGEEAKEAIVHPNNTPKDTPDSVKVEKRKILSEDSDGDGDPSIKKSRSDSTVDNKRRSLKSGDGTEDVTKKIRAAKKNDTELECRECEFRSLSVRSWVQHLSRTHSTTPELAGLALLCECGLETLSDFHSRSCAGNTTVICKSDGPPCVQCDIHPKTAIGYCVHLRSHHNSTLAQNGIYLKCSCGLEVRTHHNCKHLDKCNPRQFTLHKLDD